MDTKGMSFAERNEYQDMVLEDYTSYNLNKYPRVLSPLGT